MRSPNGGPTRSRSAASMRAKVRRRLYQSSRLPSAPASGTTQNRSSGSKSYGWQYVQSTAASGAARRASRVVISGSARRYTPPRYGRPTGPRRTTGHGSSTTPLGQRNGVVGSVGSPNNGFFAGSTLDEYVNPSSASTSVLQRDSGTSEKIGA